MSKANRFKYTPRRRQSGVAAIEFAIVFPVFFLVLYALIGYAFVFLIQSGLQNLASETARQAATISTTLVQEGDEDPVEKLEDRLTELGLITGEDGTQKDDSWLARFNTRFCEDDPPTFEEGLLTICVQADFPLPILNLFGISIPGTPDPLTTTASIFLD
ncbi:TadE/TadG family type IV pilus assembly protein [Chromohalobacter nigrandesensis]|uniref:TadE/TadG family type IV pilus assembly protein n=1 Tax=Chromohalobacter nigrandesensis TaxID=119863 RepID=UPI001FF2AE87|nr:TadE family protein [Chromohalobacter nigrandesensis]MCK0743714.1 pilus assembly protein [Chromohalobacter nigrandesensis]